MKCGGGFLLWLLLHLHGRVGAVDFSFQRNILHQLYLDTAGRNWRFNDGWFKTDLDNLDHNDDVGSGCTYAGVTCYDESNPGKAGFVQSIDLSNNNLVGTLPTTIWELPYLETLKLSGNRDLVIPSFVSTGTGQIRGGSTERSLRLLDVSQCSLPNGLDGLGNYGATLKVLQMTKCNVMGAFPPQILDLVELESLLANYNQFSGSLPPGIENLFKLQDLQLFENKLSGKLSTELGRLINLQTINLAHNAWTGTIPQEFGQWTDLQVLALNPQPNNNKPTLTGPIPSFSQAPHLRQVYLQDMQLQGPIPSDFVVSSSGALTVDLSNNQLTGDIPLLLRDKTYLDLRLQGNRMQLSSCNSLPTEWFAPLTTCDGFLCPAGQYGPETGKATATEPCQSCPQARYWGTTECGTTSVNDPRLILTNFYQTLQGRYWQQSNGWTNEAEDICTYFGVECNSAGAIVGLRLPRNGLTGTLGNELKALFTLLYLDLSGNDLDVTFAGLPTGLQELRLSQTGLQSLQGVQSLTRLRVLDISGNGLEGNFPETFYQIESLEEINLSHNRFSGALTSRIGALVNLQRFECFGNQLSGSLPAELGNLVNLRQILAAENRFNGALPATLGQLTNLETLSLHQTTWTGPGLTGNLPAFSNMAQLTSLQLDGNSLSGNLPSNFLENTRRGSERVEVVLSDNKISGTIPPIWSSRFSSLVLDLTGNRMSGLLGSGDCSEVGGWMDGTVATFGCNAVLCRQGTFNAFGRQTSSSLECETCSQATYFGTRQCGNSPGADTQTLNILKNFFAATNGNNWKDSSGWMTSGDYCTYFGIACNGAGEVAKISLKENNLAGSFTTEIYTLPGLIEINLDGNNVVFSFDGIDQASTLGALFLSGIGLNSVEGVSKASSLTELRLNGNNLKRFPDELLSLSSLHTLYMNFNQIQGTLPPNISQLKKLENLFLYHNRMTGRLPLSIGSMLSLRQLGLSENNFSGTLPQQLNNLVNLELLGIQREGGTDSGTIGVGVGTSKDDGPGLTGPLLSFDRLTDLHQLYLGTNSLSGTIPSNFLDGVEDKDVSIEVDLVSNRLEGAIPASLARFQEMNIYLAGNAVSSIPDGLCRQSAWMQGEVGSFQCDAILCEPGTASVYGRQADSSSGCVPCPANEVARYYGSRECLDTDSQQKQSELDILNLLYKQTGGNNWLINKNWLDRDLSFCEFFGIQCTADGHVETIHLMQNGLSGSIPPTIFDLPFLREINFARNDVDLSLLGAGRAPNLELLNLDSTRVRSLAGIQGSSQLRILHAGKNDLGGVFPADIIGLRNLEALYLSDSAVGSSVPSGFTGLSNLKLFECSRCGLSRGLATIASVPSLEKLVVAGNSFSESIPESLGNMPRIELIDLSDQEHGGGALVGNLTAFSSVPRLKELYLQNNALEGTIPTNFLVSTGISGNIVIDLRSNQISGSVPVQLQRFQDLDLLLTDNLIEEVPVELCPLAWNGTSNVPDCSLLLCDAGTFNGLGRATSDLPCDICPSPEDAPFLGSTSCGPDLERMILLELFSDLGGSQWLHNDGWGGSDVCGYYGVTCHTTELRRGLVKSIRLSSNNINGRVSSNIWLLTHMEELDLSNNAVDLSFELIGDAVTLSVLNLSQTNILSMNGIERANSLTELRLANCGIEGPFPQQVLNLPLLEIIDFDHNRLAGSIPETINSLSQLTEVHLSFNEMTGQIPSSFGTLIFIKNLSLGNNLFTGTIPRIFSAFPFLEVLDLQQKKRQLSDDPFQIFDSGLVGDLPAFNGVSRLRELYLANNGLGGTIPPTFLAGVNNKTAPLLVDLSRNNVHGSIPAELASFSDLRLLLSGNQIDQIPQEICGQEKWMNGLLASGCEYLLCDKGTYNKYGRRVETEDCEPCEYFGAAEFFGSTSCGPQLFFPTDEEVLVEFYKATGGADWFRKDNWTDDSVPVCRWYGVQCEVQSGQSVVVGIELPSNNLIGYPSFVLHLPGLKYLDLSDNPITMSFKDIHEAENLEEINLSSTATSSLVGIEQSTSLQVLRLDDNDFYGQTIPDELYSVTTLRELHVSRCGFGGSISEQLGSLQLLESLTCVDNDLSGHLPEAMGTLSRLKELQLSNNNFFGTLPTSMENLLSLVSISIDGRQRASAGLSGPLPSFALAPGLGSVDLGGNSLTGTIPGRMLASSDPSQFITLLLDNNLLTGTIPSELGDRFTKLNIDVTGNELSGIGQGICDNGEWLDGDVGRYGCDGILCPPGYFSPIGRQSSSERCIICPGEESSPVYGRNYCPALAKAQAREILALVYNRMGGGSWKRSDGWLSESTDICDWWGITCNENRLQVESLILGSNNLVNTPPTELFELPGLKRLWLYSNPIDFRFDGIDKAKDLTSLQLDSTGLSSLKGIGAAPALVDVDVRFNNLQGTLPVELSRLKTLETFFCGDNQLSGSIPSFDANTKLTQIRLNGNDFSGRLPSWAVHGRLHTVDVSNNQLTGTIPDDFLAIADTSAAVFLDLSNNMLIGDIPEHLSRFTDLTIYAGGNQISSVDPSLCGRLRWNNNDVGVFGCDGILCPPRSFSSTGRASQDGSRCVPCQSVETFGSTTCEGGASAASRPVMGLMIWIFVAVSLL